MTHERIEAAMPPSLRSLDEARIVDVDVRDDLRAGREPFSRIMAARRDLPPDGVLRLRAIFEPYPLYGVLGSQGMSHWTERLADDDWRVWFWATGALDAGGEELAGGAARARREDAHTPAPATPTTPGDASDPVEASTAFGTDDGAVVLDVRGLEPPEPMTRTLAALEELDADTTLVQLNERIPRFLLPHLEERGFAYHIRQQAPDLVRVFIRRK